MLVSAVGCAGLILPTDLGRLQWRKSEILPLPVPGAGVGLFYCISIMNSLLSNMYIRSDGDVYK